VLHPTPLASCRALPRSKLASGRPPSASLAPRPPAPTPTPASCCFWRGRSKSKEPRVDEEEGEVEATGERTDYHGDRPGFHMPEPEDKAPAKPKTFSGKLLKFGVRSKNVLGTSLNYKVLRAAECDSAART